MANQTKKTTESTDVILDKEKKVETAESKKPAVKKTTTKSTSAKKTTSTKSTATKTAKKPSTTKVDVTKLKGDSVDKVQSKPKTTQTKKSTQKKSDFQPTSQLAFDIDGEIVEVPLEEIAKEKAKPRRKGKAKTDKPTVEINGEFIKPEIIEEKEKDVIPETKVEKEPDKKDDIIVNEEKVVAASVKEEVKEIVENKESNKLDADLPKDNKIEEHEPEKVNKKNKTKHKRAKKIKFNYPLERVEADAYVGLTSKQVEERVQRGNVNTQPNVVSKSYLNIFRTNVLTLFNILNFFLATMILIYGELKNALFMGVVICNMIVGIVQEIRSKLTLEKMSLLTTPTIDVVRDGTTSSINIADLVLDDVIVLKQGEQVPADSIVIDGLCEVNESLLTGEQDDVHKEKGSELLSGSFIQAGEVRARINAVGEDNYTSKLMAEAKQFKKPKSELMRSINWIIRIVTILIFPIGILMFLTNMKTTSTINQAVTGTVASIVGMIPEGLVMLTSVALAAGIVKLAKKRTLVQDLYCIETLARVDVLCLDKTGTITEGSMQVEQTHIYSTKYGLVDDIMANMVQALGAQGATFEAFDKYFTTKEKFPVISTIPFSSARKWSGVDFGEYGRFIVGAPEFVLKTRYNLVENDAKEFTQQGYRVLCLVKTTEKLSENMDENKMKPIALIVLSDKIRENAQETFEYFAKQGVNLKVISGDNPITVSKVAERAGLPGAEKFIDASVDLDTPEKIYDACDKFTIFGRVSPKQKKILVSCLKQKGYTVGMTGDGVNDVMALKEADCSIAMASGSEASRNVAQLVLLDSDFSALPSVVAEGRRVINNIERAASLFLVKTTYSMILSLLLIIFQMNYPFEPIQLTIISGLFVGIPSFFLALEPNDSKVSGSFLSKVFKKAIPAGLTVAFSVWLISFLYKDIGLDVSAQISTMSFYLTSVVAVIVLLQVCMPYNKERLFLIAMAVVIFIAAVSSNLIRSILGIVPLTTDMMIKSGIIIACSPLMILFMRAEVEAFKALFKEIKSFFVRTYLKIAKFFGKNKNDESTSK